MTPHDILATRRARPLLLALVAVLLAATVLGALASAHAVQSEQRRRFDAQAERLDTALAERMRAYEQVLRGGLGLFVASAEVTRADWVRYVETLDLDQRYPGFKSLSFAQAVATEDLPEFVRTARAERGGDYDVRAPDGAGGTPDLHAPIRFVAPDDEVNQRVLGVDMMLEPTRREAMTRAVRSGEAVASPRLRLSGSLDEEAGFIVYVPVRRDGELLGWLTAAFLAEAFTSGLGVARATDLELEIRDGTGPDAQLLSSSRGTAADGSPLALEARDSALETTHEVAVPGGAWQVHYRTPPGFVPTGARLLPWLVALLGLLLTGVVLVLARAADRWRRLAVVLDEQSVGLREARETAEAATSAKSTFVATMSHEIRTPLNAVLGANSLLLESGLAPEQARYAAAIRSSGDHLLHVVNDILDLSKAEAGRVVLEHEPFDLEDCVRSAFDLVAAAALGKGLDLVVDVRAPGRVVGDAPRLRQVLVNLVANAVDFTPADGQVRVSAVGQDVDLVAFEVADTGIGIPADRLEHLFEPFVQVGTSTPRAHGGTGLGLSIARGLVEAMGGDLGVESAPGLGSTFRFTVRLPAAAPCPTPTAGDPDQHAQLDEPLLGETHPLRVLVAEDDAMTRMLAERMLEMLGHRPEVVADGAAAVAAVAAAAYDVVLLDRHMPGLDGVEAARLIRAAGPEGARPRIVAVTGSLEEGGGFEGLADDVVPKPFTLDDLAAALRRAAVCPVTPPGDDSLLR